ncbi:MAG: hypothetical protein K1W02_07520 [Muribaculaceae bacterium]
MNIEKLHKLIDDYFEGNLTVGMEKKLCQELLSFEGEDEAVDEALAVMGYSGISESGGGRKGDLNRNRIIAYVSAAAAIIVAVTFAFSLIMPQNTPSECFAYIGGERCEDREVVMTLMANELGEMSEAADEIENLINADLNDFSEVLTEIE